MPDRALFDQFESIVTPGEIRRLFERGDYLFMAGEHWRIAALAAGHGYAADEASAVRFASGYILHIKEKYRFTDPTDIIM